MAIYGQENRREKIRMKENKGSEQELRAVTKILAHLNAALDEMATVKSRLATPEDMTKVEIVIANLEWRQEYLQEKAAKR